MKRKGRHFDDWLKGQLEDPRFRRAFEEEDLKATLAVRIAQLRQEKGITQAELARRMGATQQMVSDIETFAQANLTLATLQRIASALGSRLVVELR